MLNQEIVIKLLTLQRPLHVSDRSVIKTDLMINDEHSLVGRGWDDSIQFMCKWSLSAPDQLVNSRKEFNQHISCGFEELESNLDGERAIYFNLKASRRFEPELFSILIHEVITHPIFLADPYLAVLEALKKLKNLIEASSIKISLPELVGLFGELVILQQALLYSKLTPGEAIKAWKGPFKSVHDFEFKNRCLEVKTVLSNNSIVHVNGLEQLNGHDQKRLEMVLVSLALIENGINLRELISQLETQLGSETRYLYEALAGFDILRAEDADSSIGFEVKHLRWFNVDANFPKLSLLEMRLLKLENKIVRLNYELDIASLSFIEGSMREINEDWT